MKNTKKKQDIFLEMIAFLKNIKSFLRNNSIKNSNIKQIRAATKKIIFYLDANAISGKLLYTKNYFNRT